MASLVCVLPDGDTIEAVALNMKWEIGHGVVIAVSRPQHVSEELFALDSRRINTEIAPSSELRQNFSSVSPLLVFSRNTNPKTIVITFWSSRSNNSNMIDLPLQSQSHMCAVKSALFWLSRLGSLEQGPHPLLQPLSMRQIFQLSLFLPFCNSSQSNYLGIVMFLHLAQ